LKEGQLRAVEHSEILATENLNRFFYFFDVSNFKELVGIAYKKNYKKSEKQYCYQVHDF